MRWGHHQPTSFKYVSGFGTRHLHYISHMLHCAWLREPFTCSVFVGEKRRDVILKCALLGLWDRLWLNCPFATIVVFPPLKRLTCWPAIISDLSFFWVCSVVFAVVLKYRCNCVGKNCLEECLRIGSPNGKHDIVASLPLDQKAYLMGSECKDGLKMCKAHQVQFTFSSTHDADGVYSIKW